MGKKTGLHQAKPPLPSKRKIHPYHDAISAAGDYSWSDMAPSTNSIDDAAATVNLSPLVELPPNNEKIPSKSRNANICGIGDAATQLEMLNLSQSSSSIYSDSDKSSSPRERRSPFERYSAESSFSLRQRAVSDSVASSSQRGILKSPLGDQESRRKTFSVSEAKHVSFSPSHSVRIFSSDCGLDEQAARRKKNEKKRQKKARKDGPV